MNYGAVLAPLLHLLRAPTDFAALALRDGLPRVLRMPGQFLHGAGRVLRMLDQSEAVDEARERRVVEQYPLSAPAAGRIRRLRHVWRHLLRELPVSATRFEPEHSPALLYCGGTANNEREFEWLGTLPGVDGHLPAYRREDMNFFRFARRRSSAAAADRALVVGVRLLAMGALAMRDITPRAVHHMVHYARFFVWAYQFCAHNRRSLPRLAVVANDHSAAPVAFSMIMRLWRIPRVYLQHAEVSPRFPQIDFEYSVLRNTVSADVYRAIGPVRGELFVVPRDFRPARYERLLEPPSAPVAVVLYPSSVFESARLQDAIHALRSNPQVSRCALKPHPRSRRERYAALDGVELLDTMPAWPHVAIVPNSSVALELLRQGVPVYQLFTLDAIAGDYYGFVRSGVTHEIGADDLQRPFWHERRYTPGMIGCLAQFDPLLDGAWRGDLARITARMAMHVTGGQ